MQETIRKVSCYTKEQQKLYESLNYKQRQYVDMRARGISKTEAYKGAGYTSQKNCSTNACQLEKKYPIEMLIEIQRKSMVADELFKGDGSTAVERVERLENLKGGEIAQELTDNSSGELAKQVKFYLDISSGKTKSKKTTIYYNADGSVKSKKEEIVEDVDAKMRARKKVDELLGLNAQREMGKVKAGPITIKIVDCGRREEPENINIDVEKTEDGDFVEADLLKHSLVEEGEEEDG